AKDSVAPWEEWLIDPVNLGAALAGAELERVEVYQREYQVRMLTDDYLAMLDMFAHGRFVRHRLGAARWQEFRHTVAAKVAALGLGHVEYRSRYHLAMAIKPA